HQIARCLLVWITIGARVVVEHGPVVGAVGLGGRDQEQGTSNGKRRGRRPGAVGNEQRAGQQARQEQAKDGAQSLGHLQGRL
ncbi:MAG: hypothetical protein Q8O76_02790, partial [Chloroflexota bacterium]|nr:hypothetical protein [Chloroflexota bacterium]